MNDPLAFLFTPTFDVLSENLSQNVSVQHIQENHSLETVFVFFIISIISVYCKAKSGKNENVFVYLWTKDDDQDEGRQ